jgi:hypothetical protein
MHITTLSSAAAAAAVVLAAAPLLRASSALSLSSFPPPPPATYGRDYAGFDYNATLWNSSSSLSPNHWEAAALMCQAYCEADPSCCAFTYVTPEGGSSDPETCYLKWRVPSQEANATTHWTGQASRATGPACADPSGPPYPGPSWSWPALHNSPPCLHIGGWHDIAGALLWDGTAHVFQGCPGSDWDGGWHHATSEDFVHWTNLGVDVKTVNETYGASPPCSGFMTVDDEGVPCAGFRECSGNWPNRTNQQVPLEVRCATDPGLRNFTGPEYLFWFYFNRALPYDPVRPWVGADGLWYATISADGCNATWPCVTGGREYLYSSPALRGPEANWTLIGPLFTSNYTVLTPFTGAHLDAEFITAGYFGNLTGDPLGGRTRVFTNNVNGNGCCASTTAYFLGTQRAEGEPLVVDYAEANATGMVDWGAFAPTGSGTGVASLASVGGEFMMVRTLSTHPNQVTVGGRRVMIAWIGGGNGGAQSLARDMTLDPGGAGLLQQFVPELKTLRIPATHVREVVAGGEGGETARGHEPPTATAATAATGTAWRILSEPRPRRKSVEELRYGAVLSTSRPGEERVLSAAEREAEAAAAVPVAVRPAPTLRRRVNGLSSMQVEVTALFTVAAGVTDAVFGINVLASADGQDLVPVGASLSDGQMFVGPNAGPFLPMVPAVAASIGVVDDTATQVWLHVIVDHRIVTAIFNNRTALTVVGMPRDADSTRVELFGVDGERVQATVVEGWVLEGI